ncbi:MAG: hypothetical protein JNJ73_00240 [Hyphomonadaceae bacterium]|nr:hypothetical protein [Hyphomonadaceae bacterium]
MNDDLSKPFDLAAFTGELTEAQSALKAFVEGPCAKAGDDISSTFERAAKRIAGALGRAATDGEGSMKRLAKTILEELAKVALDKAFGKPSGLALPFFGARAAGGAVTPGGAYLVGERGPEIFTPAQAGNVSAGVAAPVEVHFHLGPGADAQSLVRHQGQIAAQIARAVSYGRRNL